MGDSAFLSGRSGVLSGVFDVTPSATSGAWLATPVETAMSATDRVGKSTANCGPRRLRAPSKKLTEPGSIVARHEFGLRSLLYVRLDDALDMRD
ncbi:unnamed protein product, partial [Iphiclides podalirius]